MAWRQRLYSFLLRRIVGPYLAPSCSAKLHECLEVSLQEGKFVLKDLDLDASYLTEALQLNQEKAPVIIQKARIQKLVINLSMQETGIHPDPEQVSRQMDRGSGTGGAGGVVRNVMQIGKPGELGTDARKTPGPRVSLAAQVEIEGVDIELVPQARRSPCPNSEQSEGYDAQNQGEVQYTEDSLRKKEGSNGGRGGIISSYVDAALRSLRLVVQISDVFVKIFNRDPPKTSMQLEDGTTSWIGIRLGTASYHDVLDPSRSLSASGAKTEATRHQKKSVPVTVLHKAIDFVGVQILTGEGMPDKSEDDVSDSKDAIDSETDESRTAIVAQTEGNGQIRFRVVSYGPGTLASTRHKGSIDSNLSADKASNTRTAAKIHRQIQRDVEVFLDQRFSVCVDCVALERIETVLSGISGCWYDEEMGEESTERETTKGHEETLPVPVESGHELIMGTQTHSDFDSKNDVTILSGMMSEYAEARSLASTREVRGGILVRSCSFDDSSQDGDHEGTFDAFFDANDQSFHHYRSILSESARLDEQETDVDTAFIRTKVKFHLLEGSMKLVFPSVGCCSPLASLEYVLVTFGDLDVTASISRASSDLTLIVAHFEVEDAVSDQLPSSTTTAIGSLLRFIQTDEGQCEMDNSFIVSPAPCISLHISLTQECLVEATLQPLDLTYRHSTFSRISGMLGSFAKTDRDVIKTDTQAGRDSVDEKVRPSLLVKVTCNAFSISMPMDTDNSKISDSGKRDFDALFERCGYNLSNSIITTEAALGFTMQGVSIVIETGSLGLGELEGSKSGGQTTTVACEHAILFASSNITDGVGVCHGTKRSDLMAWSGITDVEPNSLITFQHNSQPSFNGFPMVPPLSSVKARQEYESGDVDSSKRSARTSTFAASAGSNPSVRGSDPQKAMSAEVNDACFFIDVHIPYCDCDWTAEERASMLGAITGIITNIAGLDDTRNQPSRSQTGHKKKKRIAVGISCDQWSSCMHDNVATDDAASRFSYMLVADGYKSHVLIGSEGFKNIRVLSHDLTLFEIHSTSNPKNSIRGNELDSVVKRCKEVRSRCYKNSTSRSKPLLHRSKLSHPLSPDTPAFLLDILMRASNVHGDGDYKENTIYFSLYDMTHRYDVESEWFSRFLRVLRGRPRESLSMGTDKDCSAPTDGRHDVFEEVSDDSSSMTSIFISLADCALDYSSPARCQTASRTMISVSELRMSSNIVAPSGDVNVQAYKVAVSDVAVRLCNHRFPYNPENSRLTRAKALINTEDRDMDGSAGSYPKAINEMEFITVATLDSLDALLSHANNSSQSGNHQHKPNLTATLDFGRLSLYTCRDSFACLVNTFGEWQLRFTALSDKEIDALKAAAAASENDTSARSASSKPCQLVPNTRPSQSAPRGKTVKATSLLDDAIENDIFKTGDCLVDENVNGTNGSSDPPNPYANVPDSELSASELREKHGMIQKDDVSTDLAKSLLIKNFYTIDTSPSHGSGRSICLVDGKKERHQTPGESYQSNLGGHEWTTVDHKWSLNKKIPRGEDQNAEWYESSGDEDMYCVDQGVGYRAGAQERKKRRRRRRRIHVFPQHIAVNPVPDPLSEGDMDAAKFAGTTAAPPVGLRVIIKDLSVHCRFFDGYDWATSRRPATTIGNPKTPFIVRENTEALELEKKQMHNNVDARLKKNETHKHIRDLRRKAKIMGELLDDEAVGDEGQKQRIECHRIVRQTDTFFQMSFSGLKLRFDSFTERPEHSLASCLDLSVADLFFAETVSKSKPLKMFGEWLNEVEHPRDTNDGMLMMKMVSMHPSTKISADGKLMSDESRVTLEILPLRCFLDQRACRFIRAFFAGDEKKTEEEGNAAPPEQLDELEVTATFFQVFKVKPCKLKVNYMPEKMDVEALRDGSYVELINLSPIDDMILTLQAVEIRNITGWGAAFGELVGRWVEDICATQIHKFITNSSPFQPLSSLGGSFVDLVVLPWEEIKGDGSVVEGLRSGTKSFAGAVAFETLNTTSKITGFVAKKLDSSVPKSAGDIRSTLPSRPDHTPLNIGDAADHALQSVSSGLKKANYKVVIIPYREYRRSGPAGAVKSVVRGIPVAVMAPLTGATEAISYTLLGARNCIRPDIWKEEEASLLGRGADFL